MDSQTLGYVIIHREGGREGGGRWEEGMEKEGGREEVFTGISYV